MPLKFHGGIIFWSVSIKCESRIMTLQKSKGLESWPPIFLFWKSYRRMCRWKWGCRPRKWDHRKSPGPEIWAFHVWGWPAVMARDRSQDQCINPEKGQPTGQQEDRGSRKPLWGTKRGAARLPDVCHVGSICGKSFTDVLKNLERIYDRYKENQANEKIGNYRYERNKKKNTHKI